MQTDEATFYDYCILTVEVQTDVPKGELSPRSAKTVVTLKDEGGFTVPDAEGKGILDQSFKIEALGGAEAEVLADALMWAGERLHAMIGTKRSDPGGRATS